MSNQQIENKRALVWLALLFALAGFVLSIVSFIHDMKLRYGLQKGPSFCSISPHIDCDAVSLSKWSTLFGVPLSAWGALFFILLLLASIAALDQDRLSKALWARATFFMTSLAGLSALTLFAISEFIIGAICLICVGMYLCIFALCWCSVRMLAGQSLWHCWLEGLLAVLKLPGALLGLNSAVKGKQRLALGLCSIVVVLLFVLLSLVPWALSKSSDNNSNTADFVRQQTESVVSKWRALLPVSLAISDGAPTEKDYRKGAEKPLVTIVEFFDFECPACRSMSHELDRILAANSESVAIIHKNYPLDRACNPSIDREMHRNACFSAQFARCAGEQGAYWKAAEYLFNLPELEHSEPERSVEQVRSAIERGASTLGLDQEAIKECLASNRSIAKIASDIKIADNAKLDSTPSIFINGKLVPNPHPLFLQAIINEVVGARDQRDVQDPALAGNTKPNS